MNQMHVFNERLYSTNIRNDVNLILDLPDLKRTGRTKSRFVKLVVIFFVSVVVELKSNI